MAPPKRVRGRPQRTAELPIDPRQQGLRAFQAGRFDTAIQYWITLAPADPQVRSALAEAYFRRALASPTPAERVAKGIVRCSICFCFTNQPLNWSAPPATRPRPTTGSRDGPT